MKVVSIELGAVRVSLRTTWTFLRITADDGTIGLGEASDAGDNVTIRRNVQVAASLLLGQEAGADLGASDGLDDWCATASKAEARAIRTVAGALRLALADLSARASGVPLCRFLGGQPPGEVRLYANINRASISRTPEDMASIADYASRQGFFGVKCAPFDPSPAIPGAMTEAGLRTVQEIRKQLGQEVPLRVDFHHRLSFDEVLGVLPEMEALDVHWLEDAVRLADHNRARALANATALPLAGGEHAYSNDEVTLAAKAGALGYFLPDLKHAGGPQQALLLAESGARWGSRITPHNPSGPVATLASAHLAGAVSNFDSLEFAFGEVDWRPQLIEPPEDIVEGNLRVTERPGLGIDLNESIEMHEILPTSYSDSSC